MMIGSAISVVAMVMTAGLISIDSALWMIFAVLTLVGFGLGVATNAALQVVRLTTEDQVIGRVTAAHDFGRNIGFSGGTAVGGGLLLAVMSSRVADIELVRDVLAGVEVEASAEVADAVSAGMQVMLLTGSSLAAVGLLFAWSLRRWRLRQWAVLSDS